MKYFFCISFLIFLIGCTQPHSEKIKGTWEMFSDNYGIIEKTFNDETVVTKYYYGWNNPDFEFTENYTFIDNILFIEAYGYNYHFNDNKLFLLGRNEIEIYTKKTTEKSISEKHKLLTGRWEGDHIEMIFLDNNTVHINECDDDMNIIVNDIYPYELTEKTIIIKEIEKDNNYSKFMNQYILRFGNYLYKLNDKTLILKVFHPENGLIIQYYLFKMKS